MRSPLSFPDREIIQDALPTLAAATGERGVQEKHKRKAREDDCGPPEDSVKTTRVASSDTQPSEFRVLETKAHSLPIEKIEPRRTVGPTAGSSPPSRGKPTRDSGALKHTSTLAIKMKTILEHIRFLPRCSTWAVVDEFERAPARLAGFA